MPLLVRAPGLEPGTNTTQTGLDDLPSLILGLLFLQRPASWTGEDPLLDETGPVLARNRLYDGRQRLALVDGDRKLVQFEDGKLVYDLAADPGETSPLADPDNARRLARLARRLQHSDAPGALQRGVSSQQTPLQIHVQLGGNHDEPVTLLLRAHQRLTVHPETALASCGQPSLLHDGRLDHEPDQLEV